jgi:hypothetical protein
VLLHRDALDEFSGAGADLEDVDASGPGAAIHFQDVAVELGGVFGFFAVDVAEDDTGSADAFHFDVDFVFRGLREDLEFGDGFKTGHAYNRLWWIFLFKGLKIRNLADFLNR